MARYRCIDVRIHGDAKWKALSRPQPNAQTLFFYLMTGPHTTSFPGLSSIGEASLAEALEWPLEGLRLALAEVIAQGMVYADLKARVLWLPNAMKYNPPQSLNAAKSWAFAIDEIPECDLRKQAISQAKSFLQGISEAFVYAFDQALAQGISYPEQTRTDQNRPEQTKTRIARAQGGAGGGTNGNSLVERVRRLKAEKGKSR